MSKTIIVFYAGLVLLTFDDEKECHVWRRAACHGSPEIYNGAYVFNQNPSGGRPWYRMDGTPVLLSDVPKELRAWQLVMS